MLRRLRGGRAPREMVGGGGPPIDVRRAERIFWRILRPAGGTLPGGYHRFAFIFAWNEFIFA